MKNLNTIMGFNISYPCSNYSIWTCIYHTNSNSNCSMTTPLLSSSEEEEQILNVVPIIPQILNDDDDKKEKEEEEIFVCKNHNDVQTYYFDDIKQAKEVLGSSGVVDCEDGAFQVISSYIYIFLL